MYQQIHKTPETKKGKKRKENDVEFSSTEENLDVMLVKLPTRPSVLSEYINERRGLLTRVNVVDEIFD